MPLTFYDWVYGITQLSVVFLSIVAGFLAISLFKVSRSTKSLSAWKYLIVTLVLFAIEEVLGILASFGVYKTPFLTHIIPSFILGFLIIALVKQININRGWIK